MRFLKSILLLSLLYPLSCFGQTSETYVAPVTVNLLKTYAADERMVIFDSTDHQLVVYLNGNWYPISVGSPLSN